MTTAAPSTALVTIRSAFTDAERLALAGFLAGYRGLTREAYALDLRQFTTWCCAHSLNLFAVRRADIESFARDLEARGRARATVTRRLCTIRFLQVRGRGRTSRALPGRPRPAAASRLRVARRRPGPQRARRAVGCRRTRPAARACADLAAGIEWAASLRGYWRRHRAPGPRTRAPDAHDHPQGRKGRHHPARATYRPGNRPGHRRTHRWPGLPDRRRATAGPARRRADLAPPGNFTPPDSSARQSQPPGGASRTHAAITHGDPRANANRRYVRSCGSVRVSSIPGGLG
jgi:hypothetical protein